MAISPNRVASRLMVLLALVSAYACSGGGAVQGPPALSNAEQNSTGRPVPATCTGTLIKAATGGSLHVAAGTVTYTFTIPPAALTANTNVNITYIPKAGLPAPLIDDPFFTKGAGNTYISAFSVTLCSATMKPQTAISVSAPAGATTKPKGTTFLIAINASSTWQDVGTAIVGTGGTIQSDLPTPIAPGIHQTGKFLIYLPAQGTDIVPSNLGVVLAGDDTANDPGASPPTPNPNIHGVNILHLEDTKGNALVTPVLKLLQMPSAADTDGLTLTPDASHGAVVTGFNKVLFFSGVQTGSPIVSPVTLDITAFGGEGDAIADLPNGDESVLSGDSPTKLVVISGILSGSPVEADTIPIPNNRDSLVMSNDGKVLLARGASGLTVWKVNTVAPHLGSLGHTVTHTYTLVKDFSTAGYPAGSHFQDGRGGMALCPSDSSRGIVLNAPATDDVSLITGLPAAPKIMSVAHIPLAPAARFTFPASLAPQLAGMHSEFITVSGGNAMGAVSITQTCKFAVIGTANLSPPITLSGSGLIVLTGITTGTLSQVGANFNPTITDMDHHAVPLGPIGTLAITLDAKYVGVFRVNANHAGYDFGLAQLYDRGEFFTVAIDSTGHLSIKGQLDNVAIPLNDQAVAH